MKAFPSSWANANTSIEPVTKDLREATSAIGQQIEVVPVSTNRDIERAFTSFETWVDALLVSPSPLLDNRRAQVVTLATYHRLPTMLDVPGEYQYRRSDELRIERFRTRPPCWHLCGSYPQRRKKTELPVIQASKFELVINQQTTRLLGIVVPPTLLALADEVLE
jgi:putative ABC transport system substrate-binding protein